MAQLTVATRHHQELSAFDILHGDDYFEPIGGSMAWGDFNDGRFISDVIRPLATGNRFTYRPYTWDGEPPLADRQITVHAGVIIERCYSFSFELDWDLKVWIETPAAVCLARGLRREAMPASRVLTVWRDIWQPREDQYILEVAPQRSATLVIGGTGPLDHISTGTERC